MKKFTFKLEPVLSVRRSKEEEIQVRMAEAMDRLNAAIEEMNSIKYERYTTLHQLEDCKTHPVGVEDLIIYQNYLDTLDTRINEQERLISALDQEVESVRALLIKASQDKKAIEKIKEKRKTEYDHLSLRDEINFLDEIGTNRCARKLLAGYEVS